MFGFLMANESSSVVPYNGRSSRQLLISMIFGFVIPLATHTAVEEEVTCATPLCSYVITFRGAEIFNKLFLITIENVCKHVLLSAWLQFT